MKIKPVMAVLLAMLFSTLNAQNVKEATWVATIGEPVANVYNSQLNVPLVQTKANNLYALEPSTGAVLWKTQLPMGIDKIDAIQGTPFSIVTLYNPGGFILLNLKDGKFIDVKKEIQGTMTSWHLIPESYDLLFYSKDPDYFLVIDLFAFSIRWNQKTDFTNKPASKMAKMGFGLPGNPTTDAQLSMECPPISNKSGGLIFAGNEKMTNVDGTGKVIWRVDQPKKKKGGMVKTIDNLTELMVDETSDVFYILKSKNMMAVKISDGSSSWSDFYEVKGTHIADTGNGLMPMSIYGAGQGGGMFTKSKLNLADATTGKAIWPAELELKGFVDKYRMLDDHTMLVVTFNETNSKLQVIDLAQGKFRYPEEVALKGRVMDFLIGSDKVVVITSKGLDMFELATGRDLLPSMQKFDSDADVFNVYRGTIAYSIDGKNRKVYRTDLTKGASEEIVKNYKFDANAPLTKYDVLENGNIFLASAHHMQIYSPTGVLIKDQPFDYSGKGMEKFDNAMAVADKVSNTIGMAMSIAASAYVMNNGLQAGAASTQYAAELSVDFMAPELAAHDVAKNQRAAKYYLESRRIKKDISSTGTFFVRRNKDVKADYLSYVSKADGTVLFDIPLSVDAKEPEFAIDDMTGTLYYAPRYTKDPDAWLFVSSKEKQAQQKTSDGIVAGYKY